jgi:beta-glucosidase
MAAETAGHQRRFPPGFLWGVAVAAHQVEGGNTANQWWDWEQQPGRIWHGDRSGDACGWWRDPAPDLDRAAALGLNALRLSIEWSRIEPEEGRIDGAALQRYRELLQAIRQRGMAPMVTLHHFTHPRWLEAQGGWLHPGTPARFGRFAGLAVQELGDLCQLWCTINEPVVFAVQSYLFGVFPPGYRSFRQTGRVIGALLSGHAMAAAAIRRQDPALAVGLVHQLRLFDAVRPTVPDRLATRLRDYWFNGLTLTALRTGRASPMLQMPRAMAAALPGSCTFLGVNYYTRERVRFDWRAPRLTFASSVIATDAPHSDRGHDGQPYGEIYPAGLFRALRQCAGLGLPLYITEIGVPDVDDHLRPDVIRHSLAAVHRALADGVDVRGFFWWTLIDNFEWAEGWGLRFGLYAFDERTGERRRRPSADVYAAIARANALPDEPPGAATDQGHGASSKQVAG